MQLGQFLVSWLATATLHEARLYRPQPMNILVVGADPSPLLDHLPEQFLLIDDGPLIDQITVPDRRRVTFFDTEKHSFNPLKDMGYRSARDFIAVLDAAFPEGANTLTRRYSNFILLNALLGQPKRLSTLLSDSKDPYERDAWQKIQTLLLSPVLERVLNHPTNLSLKGIVLARLDRAKLGDFDCFVLGNLLASLYQGPVVIPDFGFYQAAFHVNLIRQQRLYAGIRSFEEVPQLRTQLLLIERKIAAGATPEDAGLIGQYEGLIPGTDGHTTFVQQHTLSPHRSRERA